MKKRLMSCMLLLLTMFCFLLPLQVHAAAAPAQPVLTGVTSPAYNKIKVSWKKVPNATKYYVYYRGGGETWKCVGSTDGTKTSFTHTSSSKLPLEVGRNYLYTVKAYSSSAKKYSTYDKAGLKMKTLPEKPVLSKVELTGNNLYPFFSWEETPGCDYYIVYRKSVSHPTWERIGFLNKNTRWYNDLTAPSGEKVTYTVKGYSSKYKAYGTYDKTGTSILNPTRTSTENDLQIVAAGYTSELTGFPKGSTFKSSNKNIINIVSTTSTSFKFTAKAAGKATVTVTSGKTVRTVQFTVMNPGNDFVKAWSKKTVNDMNLYSKDVDNTLIRLSIYMNDQFTTGKALDLTDMIMNKKGDSRMGAKLYVELCKALGYTDATARLATGDNMKRYPSKLVFEKNHYNVKVVCGKRIYYMDGTPQRGYVYMSNETTPCYMAEKSGSSWIRKL